MKYVYSLSEKQRFQEALNIVPGRVVSKRTSGTESKRLIPEAHLHRHLLREMLIVLDGRSRFRLNDKEFTAVPGMVFLCDHWDLHNNNYYPEDRGLLHIWVYLIGGEVLVRCCSVLSDGNFVFLDRGIIFPSYLNAMFEHRWMLCTRLSGCDCERETELMHTPISYLLEELRDYFNAVPSRGDDGMISAITHYIESQNGRNCALSQLERISGYNRYYIAHRFKAATGFPVGKYIDKVRRDVTVEALKQGCKQKEIAEQLGFSSGAVFWKWWNNYVRRTSASSSGGDEKR